MRSSNLLFLRLLQVSSLVFLAILGLLSAIQPDPEHYYRSSIIKSELLKQTPAPRIIVVGGSNIAWGIDSGLIEKELGLPAINDGLDLHLGITPLLELKAYIQPGDIIVISLEYYNFASPDEFFGIPQYQADWIEFSPARVVHLQNPYQNALPMLAMVLQRKINREVNAILYNNDLSEFRGIYNGQNFNKYGDFIGHIKENNAPGMNADYGGFPVNQLDEAYDFLEEFNKFATQQGAIVFYEAPAARQTNCELTGEKYIRKFYNVLQTRTKIPLLTSIKDLCYPDDYFYDTPYHLNEQGREVRTERLIQNLKNYLEENK